MRQRPAPYTPLCARDGPLTWRDSSFWPKAPGSSHEPGAFDVCAPRKTKQIPGTRRRAHNTRATTRLIFTFHSGEGLDSSRSDTHATSLPRSSPPGPGRRPPDERGVRRPRGLVGLRGGPPAQLRLPGRQPRHPDLSTAASPPQCDTTGSARAPRGHARPRTSASDPRRWAPPRKRTCARPLVVPRRRSPRWPWLGPATQTPLNDFPVPTFAPRVHSSSAASTSTATTPWPSSSRRSGHQLVFRNGLFGGSRSSRMMTPGGSATPSADVTMWTRRSTWAPRIS